MTLFDSTDYIYFVIVAYGVTFLTLTFLTFIIVILFFRRRRDLFRLEREVNRAEE